MLQGKLSGNPIEFLPLPLNQRAASLALRLDDRLFRLVIVGSTRPGLIVSRRTAEIRTVDIEKERPDAVLNPRLSSSSKRRDQICEIAWMMAKGNVIRARQEGSMGSPFRRGLSWPYASPDRRTFPASPSASWRRFCSVVRSNGLARYATAPRSVTRSRVLLLGNAVMKMTGIFIPHFMRYSWSCGPLIPRIWTSAIKHRVLSTSGEPKNASQDSKVSTSYPNVSTSPPVATRTLSSSSIMDINGTKARIILPCWNTLPVVCYGRGLHRNSIGIFAAATSQIRGLIIVSISQLALSMI
jgi:hypothetical protein